MGCGSSISTATRTKIELFEHSQFKSSVKKPKDGSKFSIEDARKRRQEVAKERTRRASVMGLLEAEKLKQRKLSNASVNLISVTTETEDESIESAKNDEEPRPATTECENEAEVETEHRKTNISNEIRIVISPETRSNSSATINAETNEDKMERTNTSQVANKDSKKESDATAVSNISEQQLRQIQAEQVVKSVLQNAITDQ